ncbi:hypothetical protein C9374_012833 [Naegleria lovaniensis]|uniref:Protein kinase domain-containing protein n=1 Tax=Naegleria lovaniensis TaxID=51637 RepID=A0AA88KEB5_NAELO|nr:uncharacterized protein C9374_012833 [Naegleria lovaniensis]KAG2373101.1 hypothetical protein C9374_012833 [Naegleria lovaniensis]
MSTSNNNKLEYSSLSNHQCQPLESKNNTATSLEFSNAGYINGSFLDLESMKRKRLHIQLLPDDEIVLTSNSCYEIKGTVQTCEDTNESLEGKQVVLVKSRSTSFYLTIFNSELIISQCKPPFSIFLKDVNSCKVFRESSLLATPKNFEVSLCGQCLTKLLSSLTPESKKRIVIELLCETQFIHSRNIIHNDIKLDNVVIYTDKKQLQYSKYIDFELSKRFDKYNMNEEVCTDNNAETLFSGSGTPGYYPPEKLAVMNDRNTVDLRYSLTPKSDIYSLGIVLLEILTGNSVNDSYSIEDAFTTLSRDHDFASMHGIISCMIHPDKSKRPTASMILQTLIQEKGWDLKLAHEGWKKARTSLTEDFWKTHGVLERDLFDDAINNVTLEQLVQVTTTSESSEENKKRNNHPTVDVTANKKWKHASNK